MDAVLLPVHNAYNPIVDRPATREVLYEIIISDIAIPAADVPWQDILSFRTETAAQRQLRMLRRWISEIAKGKLTYAEAVDEIDYLMEEYRASMKATGLRFGMSTIRTLIVTAAEIAEDLAKLRLKSLDEAPFRLLDAHAALLDEERTAVGRELQYLFHIDNSFARRT